MPPVCWELVPNHPLWVAHGIPFWGVLDSLSLGATSHMFRHHAYSVPFLNLTEATGCWSSMVEFMRKQRSLVTLHASLHTLAVLSTVTFPTVQELVVKPSAASSSSFCLIAFVFPNLKALTIHINHGMNGIVNSIANNKSLRHVSILCNNALLPSAVVSHLVSGLHRLPALESLEIQGVQRIDLPKSFQLPRLGSLKITGGDTTA